MSTIGTLQATMRTVDEIKFVSKLRSIMFRHPRDLKARLKPYQNALDALDRKRKANLVHQSFYRNASLFVSRDSDYYIAWYIPKSQY